MIAGFYLLISSLPPLPITSPRDSVSVLSRINAEIVTPLLQSNQKFIHVNNSCQLLHFLPDAFKAIIRIRTLSWVLNQPFIPQIFTSRATSWVK